MICQISSNPNDQMPQAIPTFDPTSPDIARNIKKPINDQHIQVLMQVICTSIQVPDFCCAVNIFSTSYGLEHSHLSTKNPSANDNSNHRPEVMRINSEGPTEACSGARSWQSETHLVSRWGFGERSREVKGRNSRKGWEFQGGRFSEI